MLFNGCLSDVSVDWSGRGKSTDAWNTSHKIYYQYITPNQLNMRIAVCSTAQWWYMLCHLKWTFLPGIVASINIRPSSNVYVEKYWTFEAFKMLQNHLSVLENTLYIGSRAKYLLQFIIQKDERREKKMNTRKFRWILMVAFVVFVYVPADSNAECFGRK